MKRILFVTTNKAKIEDAKQKLKSAGIEIVQSKIKVQELKHPNVRKVVRDKAKKSFNTIKKSLIVEDSALYIPALGEFPGTQVKKAFGKLSLQDISKLLQGKKRDVKFVSALAYADKKEIKVFTHTYSGKFAKTPAGKKTRGWRLFKLFIPRGSKKTCAEMGDAEFKHVSAKMERGNHYEQFLNFIKKKT